MYGAVWSACEVCWGSIGGRRGVCVCVSYLTHRLFDTFDRPDPPLQRAVHPYASPPTHIPTTTCLSFGRTVGLGEVRVE